MKKRSWLHLIAVMMSVCMITSMMSVMAFAGDEGASYGIPEEEESISLMAIDDEELFWVNEELSLVDAVAQAYAFDGGTVVLKGKYRLEADLVIPEGVTLLLPYNDPTRGAHITINKAHFKHPYANTTFTGAESIISWPGDSDMAHQLTIAAGKTVTVEKGGMLILGGRYSGNALGLGCQTYGAHSDIVLEQGAEIVVNGILSTMGYITGDGMVTVAEGGALYEPFVVTDYHGGGYTVDLYFADMCPFNSYTMMNVQCEMLLQSGANLYGYCSLYTQSTDTHNKTTALVVGEHDALLNQDDGTTITFTYDRSHAVEEHFGIGKTTVTINGSADFGALSMVIMSTTVATNDVNFPMTYNLDLVQESGTLTVSNPVKILPGCEVWIKDDASLVLERSVEMENNKEVEHIGALYVYDGYYSMSPSGEVYPKAAELSDAGLAERGRLIIDGVLDIGAGTTFAGIVETNGNGVIVVHKDATVGDAEVGEGLGGTQTTYILTAKAASYESKGAYHLLEAGKTYYAVDNDEMMESSYAYNGNIVVDYDKEQTITGTWSFLDVEVAVKKGEITAEFRNGDSATPFVGSVMLASYNGDKQMQNVTMKTFAAEDHFSGVQKLDCSDLIDNDTTIIRVFLLDQNFVPMRAAQELELTAN